MPSSVLTTKGQITLPVEVRRDMGLKSGDRLQFRKNPETGSYEMTRNAGSVMELFGMLKYAGPPVTVEDMTSGIGDSLARDDERITREYRECLESEKRS